MLVAGQEIELGEGLLRVPRQEGLDPRLVGDVVQRRRGDEKEIARRQLDSA